MARTSAALLLLSAIACGGSAGLTFQGTVRGQSMTPRDAIASPATVSTPLGTGGVLAIAIGDVTGLCAKATANVEPRDSRTLILLVADFNQASLTAAPPSAAGAFDVYDFNSGRLPSSHLAVVQFVADDATCTRTTSSGTSGRVSLTRMGADYAGSYDVTFDSGDHVTGAFEAKGCAGLQNFVGQSTHTCQ